MIRCDEEKGMRSFLRVAKLERGEESGDRWGYFFLLRGRKRRITRKGEEEEEASEGKRKRRRGTRISNHSAQG